MQERTERRGDDRGGTSTDRDRRRTREHLEDDLDLIRGAPRDKAWRILNNLLEAVYGEGFIRGVEDTRPPPTRTATSGSSAGQSTAMQNSD